jgi:hypothetical protein
MIAKVRYAREVFLHGLPGEYTPVVDPKRLAEIAGCSASAIRNHLPAWEKEREAILLASSPTGLTIQAKREDLEANKRDLAHLRARMDDTLSSLKDLPEALDLLRDFLAEFRASASTEETQTALQVFQAFVTGVGSLKSLDTHFLTLQKRWLELSGISDLQGVATSREKAMAIARAKLDAATEGARDRAREPRRIEGFARSVDEIDGI